MCRTFKAKPTKKPRHANARPYVRAKFNFNEDYDVPDSDFCAEERRKKG